MFLLTICQTYILKKNETFAQCSTGMTHAWGQVRHKAADS